MKRILKFDSFINEKLIPHSSRTIGSDSLLDMFAKDVAAAYDDAPLKQTGSIKVKVGDREYEGTVEDFWKALNESNHKLYKQIASKYKVEFVDEDPYETAEQMRKEVKESGILKIYKGDSGHPYFSPEDNWVFRTVHDYYTHISHGENFDLRGELRAYNTHSKLVPPKALPALFTEVVGQVCWAITHSGKFPEQKMAILDGFDYRTIGLHSS